MTDINDGGSGGKRRQLTRDDLGRGLWGGMPLPVGMRYRGTVRSEHGNPEGALLLSGVGIYVLGAGGAVSSLDQREARAWDRSAEDAPDNC